VEKAEDVDELRFVENGIPLKFINVHSKTLSVDTIKDVHDVEIKLNKMNHHL